MELLSNLEEEIQALERHTGQDRHTVIQRLDYETLLSTLYTICDLLENTLEKHRYLIKQSKEK